MWNSSLLWSWRSDLMLEHSCTDCICLISLVRELDLIWMQVMYFFKLCWQLSTWYGMGLENEWLKLVPGVRWDLPSGQWLSLPYHVWDVIPSCWRRNRDGQSRAGFVPIKCVFSSLFELWHLPQSEEGLKQVGLSIDRRLMHCLWSCPLLCSNAASSSLFPL